MKYSVMVVAALLLLPGTLESQSLPKVKAPKVKAPKVGNPAKAAERTIGAALEGDTRTLRKIAEHTTSAAIERYRLKGSVTKGEIRNAQDELYAFLKWKLGSPSAAAAQYATAGYGHFDKAYADEAGAALLGFELPQEKGGHAEFILPPALIQLRLVVQKAAIPIAAQAIQETYGVPAFISSMVLNAYVEAEARTLRRLGINLPHDYDFPDGLIRLTLDARKDPEGTRHRLQGVIDRKIASK